MKLKLRYPIVSLIILIIWTTLCHNLDLYNKIWWSDIVAHYWAGIVLGLFAWYFIEKTITNRTFFMAVSIMSFALLFSFFWELYEYYLYIYHPAALTYYAGLGDTISDMICGTVGGLTIGIIYYFKRS
jgi:uncharacterized membrane protein YjdF